MISVITAKPSLVETTGSASLTVGDYNQMIVKADVNGPFSDSAGFSLSGYYNERDGPPPPKLRSSATATSGLAT